MSKKTHISGYTETEVKETLQREGFVRGHKLSHALGLALKYGLPIYLKKHPIRFVPVEEAERRTA